MIAKLTGVDRSGRPGGCGHRCRRGRLSRLLLDADDRPVAADRLRGALLIETHVREDHIHLYGFVDAAERDWFRRLTTVQGVGARLALAILSAVAPEELSLAIVAQDKAALTRADGVGARLAARIVNELRDKVGGFATAATASAPIAPASDTDVDGGRSRRCGVGPRQSRLSPRRSFWRGRHGHPPARRVAADTTR